MSLDPKVFEREWYDLAKVIANRIYADIQVKVFEKDFQAHGKLTFEQRSDFIAIANRVKFEVIHETYGAEGSDGYTDFKQRWRHWYDHKGMPSARADNRRLTNEEHIVYSSTPEAEEFFINVQKEVAKDQPEQ